MEDQDCEHEWVREIGMYGNAEVWESEYCELCDMERDGDVLR